eukprot:gene29322-38850_t
MTTPDIPARYKLNSIFGKNQKRREAIIRETIARFNSKHHQSVQNRRCSIALATSIFNEVYDRIGDGGSDAALEVSLDSGLDNMEASDADDGMCLDRESLFAEMMTQIEAAILRELQDHTQEEEPLDYEGDYDLDDIEQDHHVVICPICRMYHMNIDCTAAHCQCGALIRLYKEDLGRSLDAAELKDMLKSAFDCHDAAGECRDIAISSLQFSQRELGGLSAGCRCCNFEMVLL